MGSVGERGEIEDLGGVSLEPVSEGVVITAEQTEVVEDRLTSVGPEDDVVNVAPARVLGAPLPHAMPIPDDDCSSQRRRNHAGPSSHVQQL
jgi:hypothetical protein